MENKLLLWKNNLEYRKKYDIDKIVEDSTGLNIYLSNIDSCEKIMLFYNTIVCSYKNIDESFWISILEDKIATYSAKYISEHTFFVVENSVYAEEIAKQTYYTIKAKQLLHLEIIAANAILDIISYEEPLIKIMK